MAHGDDAGLMLPPRIAPIQVGLSICVEKQHMHMHFAIFGHTII